MTAQTVAITALTADTIDVAYKNSFYTIAGAGGELSDWIEGYGKLLDEAGIQRPTEWFTTTGGEVNAYFLRTGRYPHPNDLFRDDLTILMFRPVHPVGKLALFKVQSGDRWFDDIIDNMKTRAR
ncbi:hypothetical protein PBI_DEWDROP_6 [Microbacterium phage Dewdrop]|nr:hypothetical protein PBI_LEAF_6 [Microbacterium phage Leaf]QGZ17375.1 hypothetical protein PBI_DEWDROP_6 [Microbacterium phage Dewdrop]